MTRGRIPVRARKEADPVAEKRGIVQHYQREPGTLCDFAIMSPGIVAHVRIKCVRRLGSIGEETGREPAAEATALRIIASSREISREIWLCSPRYAWRFFRVLDHSLAELGRDGMLLPTASPRAIIHGTSLAPAGYRVIHRFMISPDHPHRKPPFRRKIPLFGHRVISCWAVSQIEVILANGGHFEQISRIAVRHIIRKNAEFGKDGCKFIRIWLI